MKTDPQAALAERVFAGGRSKPFAELTAAEVRARAEELKTNTGWGPTSRVAGVARAWTVFARAMEDAGAVTVGDLDPEIIAEHAQRLWVVAPGGSLL
jgi:hypothetical protein